MKLMGRHLLDAFPVHDGLEEGDVLSPLLINMAPEYAIRKDSRDCN
jgi:hypothetical protein